MNVLRFGGFFFFPLFITHRSLPCPSATIPALETTGEMSQITQIKWDGGPNARCREHKSPLVRSLQLLSTEPTHGARWEFQAATPSAHASTRLAHTWGRVNTPGGLQRLCWLYRIAAGRKSHPSANSIILFPIKCQNSVWDSFYNIAFHKTTSFFFYYYIFLFPWKWWRTSMKHFVSVLPSTSSCTRRLKMQR